MPVFFKKDQHVLIQLESDKDWLSFCDTCEGYITPRDFQLIHNYLKGTAKTVVIEKDYVDADYRDTYFNFFSRKFAQYPSKTIRANFFTDKITPRMLFKLDRYQDEYIGFIVLRPNRVLTIGRTILDPSKLPFVDGHICVSKYPVHILGAELIVKGEGLQQVSDSGLINDMVEAVLNNNHREVQAYLKGKDTIINWLFGQVMQEAKGKANPQVVKKTLKEQLNSRKQ